MRVQVQVGGGGGGAQVLTLAVLVERPRARGLHRPARGRGGIGDIVRARHNEDCCGRGLIPARATDRIS